MNTFSSCIPLSSGSGGCLSSIDVVCIKVGGGGLAKDGREGGGGKEKGKG